MEGTTEVPPNPHGFTLVSYPSDYLLITEFEEAFTYPEAWLDDPEEGYGHIELVGDLLRVKTGIGKVFYARTATTGTEDEQGLGRWELLYATG